MRTKALTMFGLACLVAVAVFAADHPRKDKPDGKPHPGAMGPGTPAKSANPESREEEIRQFREQLREFCQNHAPRRWADVERTGKGDKSPLIRGTGMAQRFRALQALEKEDKDLYRIKLEQIELEDMEYGLLKDLRAAQGDSVRNDELRDQLRKTAKRYVSLRFQEREHRINRLEKLLDLEKQRLARERELTDRMTEDRVTKLVAEGPEFFMPKNRRADVDGATSAPVPLNAAP